MSWWPVWVQALAPMTQEARVAPGVIPWRGILNGRFRRGAGLQHEVGLMQLEGTIQDDVCASDVVAGLDVDVR